MECDCQRSGEYLPLVTGADDFADQLELVEYFSEKWVRLYRCNKCGQHWQVDVGAEADRRTPLAIKIPDAESWANFDDGPIRKKYFIESLGGLTGKECLYKGCKNRRLNGVVFCPDHLPAYGIS